MKSEEEVEKKIGEVADMPEVSKEDMAKEELRCKKQEIEQDELILKGVPENREGATKHFAHILKGKELEIEDFELRGKGLKTLDPRYEYEATPEYEAFQKKKIVYLLDTLKKQQTEIEKQREMQIKQINEQETKIKNDLPRLRNRVKELKKELEQIENEKKNKADYVG